MTASETSRGERAPLLASGDEGMRASSSGGGWGRFALGAGTLGVIAACAALATTPASTDVGLKTLGIGLSLPRDTRGGALHHASTRPVAGGALEEPKLVLSSSVFDDEDAALGSHSGRASEEDDSERDRQFLVPTTVIDALTEKMNGKTSKHSYVGSIAKKSSSHRGVLATPVYVVAMEKSENDARRTAELLERLVRFHGADAVRDLVHITPGVDVTAWPKKIELAEYALKSVLSVRSEKQMAGLPWIETYASRGKDGRLRDPNARRFPLSHHIGCLFAHMHDWQMSFDARYENTVIFEADATDPSLLGMELSGVQTVVDHAPEDYDLIFLTARKPEGKLAKTFKDPLGNELKMYHLTDLNEEAGLSSYIVSSRFFKKMRRYIVDHGADMVDAWLSAKLCVKPAFDAKGKFVAWEENGGGEYRYLSCYSVKQDGFRSVVSDDFPKT
uniref:Uncharacterized protein n=1 Tax=Micromonas pusilla TaxID=38833 RepID=A0A7S0GRD7_MICPS